jgi:uncharacterized protein
MSDRTLDRVKTAAPAEDAAWNSLRDRVVISLRPIGAPTSIGFFGLAAATLTLSGVQLAWIPAGQARYAALALIAFAFLAQFLAGIVSLLARDGTAATAMTTLALTWLVIGLVMFLTPPGTTSAALGVFLLFAGAAMALTGATAALGKLVPAAVFGVASLRFFMTAIYHLSGVRGWQTAAGAVGVLLFVMAMYGAWATELEGALGRPVLPLGRRGKGRIAVTGSLREQALGVVNEPGVRQQL